MYRKMILPALALAGAALSACVGPFEACTDEGRFAINVTVVDSVTNRPVDGPVTLVVRDGDFVDSVHVENLSQYPIPAADERTGTFDVTVRSPGYAEWRKDDVRVTRGGRCGKLQTVSLRARMQQLVGVP